LDNITAETTLVRLRKPNFYLLLPLQWKHSGVQSQKPPLKVLKKEEFTINSEGA